ncbi:hypothetical protein BDY21DRAFT_387729 [Lineolata rhizophorae]|uniref:Glycosyl transferase CAP10 domain-containing protein n=1 Tax=Lineolata rhizophorae TaxID=578093 RepID=A0A6A6NQI9_9PEZI|nr:hypothetical protein BDY21DRAFT_387729 [Lineolata rhizophorae]
MIVLNKRLVQFIIAASVLSLLGVLFLHDDDPASASAPAPRPIDDLIRNARDELDALLAKESSNVKDAARRYRERRGRHPPPGFDAWVDFALANNATLVEDFFDQIHHDLGPFWGVEPATLRWQARSFQHTISVRNGSASFRSDRDRRWMVLWHNLTNSVARHLPDLDMPINVMDESRLLVKWEAIEGHMARERASRVLAPVENVTDGYPQLPEPVLDPEPFDARWISTGPYWALARDTCPPGSDARNAEPPTNTSGPPPMPEGFPAHSYSGYVQNWTLAKDPCAIPHIQEMHGTFIEPISLKTSKELFPMFGGSKLPMNNEILIPPAMYWTEDPFYSGGEEDHGGPWAEKHSKMMWRGAGTGGRNKKENWTRFQRHRFLSMVNGTSVRQAELSADPPPNFELPSYTHYPLGAVEDGGSLGAWVDTFSDTGFVHLVCFPAQGNKHCPYTDPYFAVRQGMDMAAQYAYKYLPDLDGNSFSGRYRGFLRSNALPVKATIYAEWHDSRLVPWLHFVPMDNSFVDVYGIMDYFLGVDGVRPGHDAAARTIAEDGQAWANRVLRREDMQIYVYRLLLEYARVLDERRNVLGYVDDLLHD